MKTRTLTSLLIIFTITAAHSQQTVLYPELKKQIDSLALLDKIAGHNNMADTTGKRDSLNKVFRNVTVSNTAIIKGIFERYGYPNYDMVGKDGSGNFWLMVQHADDDHPFQEAVLKKMKIEVERKKASGLNFAYLTDRVNVNSGRPQIYGTQLSRQMDVNGYLIPKEMIDPQNVNKRRKEIGMEPLEDYLKLYKEAMTQH